MHWKIAMVIPTLESGGAERVLSTMANAFAAEGHAVHIITHDENPSFYALHPQITRHSTRRLEPNASALRKAWLNVGRVRLIRRYLKSIRPDVVISFMDATNVITLMAARGVAPVLISERSDPYRYNPGRITSWMRRRIYPLAERLIVQSESYRGYFNTLKPEKVQVIPNPIPLPDAQIHPRPPACGAENTHNLLAVGRLGHEKGFDLLIRAFAQIADNFPAWKLVIVGEGAARAQLQQLIDDLDLRNKIALPGKTQQPGAYYQHADIFISASRFEGFPNVICEALSYGLPVIATDCSEGVRDIITHAQNGLLVPPEDVDALAAALVMLMDDAHKCQQLGGQGRLILDRYGMPVVMRLWEELIEAVSVQLS